MGEGGVPAALSLRDHIVLNESRCAIDSPNCGSSTAAPTHGRRGCSTPETGLESD
jgi:hypothetical protein